MTYQVALSFRRRGTQHWLRARWPQIASSLTEARSLALIAVDANGCEWGWLTINEEMRRA